MVTIFAKLSRILKMPSDYTCTAGYWVIGQTNGVVLLKFYHTTQAYLEILHEHLHIYIFRRWLLYVLCRYYLTMNRLQVADQKWKTLHLHIFRIESSSPKKLTLLGVELHIFVSFFTAILKKVFIMFLPTTVMECIA